LVLTIGLPLVTGMTLKQFTGVMAHEFGHFAQGSSMRLSYVVHRINLWFARMAWGRSGIDDALASLVADETHWAVALIVVLCQIELLIVRSILKGMALLSHMLSMHLSRQAEYDADMRAARVVGSVAMEDGLQMVPFVDVAHGLAVKHARGLWNKRVLPDDLVRLTDNAFQSMPGEVKEKITGQILMAETSWFDTHPPLFKRVGVLKKAKLQGVLKLQAPATAVFRDFEELCKLATIDFYQAVLGEHLKAEHLYPTGSEMTKVGGKVRKG
jgi:Zn-dependent protease with chaperone function